MDDTSDLRAVATAADTARVDDARLKEAVDIARAHGRSWNHIALALGVSRQAARQRFAHPTTAVSSGGGLADTMLAYLDAHPDTDRDQHADTVAGILLNGIC